MRLTTIAYSGALMFAGFALLSAPSAMAEGNEADFKAAYSAAEAANAEAKKLHNQWRTSAAALVASKKAADAGSFDQATAAAKQSEALAKASIFQSNEQKDAWKDAEIR